MALKLSGAYKVRRGYIIECKGYCIHQVKLYQIYRIPVMTNVCLRRSWVLVNLCVCLNDEPVLFSFRIYIIDLVTQIQGMRYNMHDNYSSTAVDVVTC